MGSGALSLSRFVGVVSVAALAATTVFVVSVSGPVGAQDSFDGQSLEVRHVTDDSTSCLDVSYGAASNGQDVWMWDCNDTDAQTWRFEKRTSGTYAGSYRLVSLVGNDSYCLDNRGDFTTSARMGIWTCVGDTDGAAANQSVTIAASGDGYTITFVRGDSSVWLTTDRASNNVYGGADQTTVSGTVPDSAVWSIGADAPVQLPALQLANVEQDPPQAQNEPLSLDGKTFELRHVTSTSTACMTVPFADRSTGVALSVAACDGGTDQKWTFTKRTAGGAANTYRVQNNAGNKLCLDNAGLWPPDYTTVYGWRCVADTGTNVGDQAVTVTSTTGGYTINFTVGTNNAWIENNRGNNQTGGVYQNTATGTPPSTAIWQLYTETAAPNFDGHIMQIYHTTTNSVGCLAIAELTRGYRTLNVGQDVVTEACDNSVGQHWQLDKMSTGDHAGAYVLRNMLYSQTYCIDNDGQFQTSSTMKVRECAWNSNYTAADNRWTSPAAQAVAIARSGNGYTLSFTSGANSSWVSTDRASNSPNGGAGQTTATGTASASAVWGIGTAADRTAGRTNADPPTITDPYDGKTFKIKSRYKSGSAGSGWIAGCLKPPLDDNDLAEAGGDLMFGSGWPKDCHNHMTETYTPWAAATSWKVEKRTSGAYSGYYRIVNQSGARDLCIDADVADSIDDGLEYTTTPASAMKGLYLDTCVGDSHAEVGSQSAKITKLPAKGAWGKNTYTITFADGTGNDATKVWLAVTAPVLTYWAGQRVVTNTVHEYAVIYLEEQVATLGPVP